MAINYILIAAQVTSALHKAIIIGPLLFRNGLTVYTLMSLVLAFPSICAFTQGAGNIFKVAETAQLLNAGKYITAVMAEAIPGIRVIFRGGVQPKKCGGCEIFI